MSLKNSNNGTEVLQDTGSSNTQSNVKNMNNSNSSEELFKVHECSEIPFMGLVEDNQGENTKWYGMIGTSKVSHDYKSKEDLEEALRSTGVTNYPQLVAIVAGYMELIAQTHLKDLANERKENN